MKNQLRAGSDCGCRGVTLVVRWMKRGLPSGAAEREEEAIVRSTFESAKKMVRVI